MNLQINGETRCIENAATVAELITRLDLPSKLLLIEHNGTALKRDEWPTRGLNENDRLEIIRIVAGG